MKNWLALKLLYCGNAHPADRLLGAPCGCVFLLKHYDQLAEQGQTQCQAENFWFCSPDLANPYLPKPSVEQFRAGLAKAENHSIEALQAALRLIDAQTASTYYYQPIDGDGEGVRWQ